MSQATKTIDIPEGVNYNTIEDIVINELNERSIEIEDISEDRGRVNITAKSPPSLLSWGEEIYIQITESEIEITSKTPNQIIDWGKSENNVEDISSSVRRDIRQPA